MKFLSVFTVACAAALTVAAQDKPVTNAPPAAEQVLTYRDRGDAVAQTLKLTEEQKQKARPLFAAEAKEINDLAKAKKLTPAKVRQVRTATDAKMMPLLTADQRTLYTNRFHRRLLSTNAPPTTR